MNILLICPTTLDEQGNPKKYKRLYSLPLPLAILDALTPPQHTVEIINDMAEEINFSFSYDLVAMTAMTTQINRAYQIAKKFRDMGVRVILGGVHATFMFEEAQNYVDSVVIGEVENIWEQILVDAENNNLKKAYKDSVYPDLKKLVIPKWDNVNLNIYPKYLGSKYPNMPIFTTRGCLFGCKFCSVTKFFGKTYRFKPIENVLKEIDSIKAKNYSFIDDNIICNPDYSKELFKAIKKRNIIWWSQASTNILKTPELIDLASQSGCWGLLLGIESINPKSLKSVNKGFNKIEEYEELFSRLRKAKILPIVSLIFGFDDDTPEQFMETIAFLIKNKITALAMWVLTPLPGTDLYYELLQQDRLLYTTSEQWSKYDFAHIVFQPKTLDTKTLYDNYWKAYGEFYSTKNLFKNIVRSAMASKTPFKFSLPVANYQWNAIKNVKSHIHPLTSY